MTLLSAWRVPLRVARRDALRHRGRSALVLVMIALPVLAVTTADVMIQTTQVSGPESVDRRMGSAEALVTVSTGVGAVEQPPDPDNCCSSTSGEPEAAPPTAEQVSSLLDGAVLTELRSGEAPVGTGKGQTSAEGLETDLGRPVTDGLLDLTSGRMPRAADEVVVNQALLGKGYAVGDRLVLASDDAPDDPMIVGVAESTTVRDYPFMAGPLGALGLGVEGETSWLVDGGVVSWAMVRQLNGIGATVRSRAVINDPPPASEVPESVRQVGDDGSTLAVLALIVVMALIEVVLLAGPSFAVGARKLQRSLALMAASGGTPRQARRVVISSAIVLGSTGAVLGVVLGVVMARLLQPLLQTQSVAWFGPFEVPWLHLLGIAAFGMLSAFLAAVVPASIASRQDVVAVLAGRRGDRPPSLRSPLVGLVLLGAGVAGSAFGATGGGEFVIAVSAIPAVLGMILLVPVVLALVARVSGRLPLVLRYAVRDANRHRTRTVPAIAAVAATVAGVVALGVGMTSDEAENRETYSPSVAAGVGIVTDYLFNDDNAQIPWDRLRGVLDRELSSATVTEQRGLDESNSFTEVHGPDGTQTPLSSSGSSLGSNIMVSDGPLPPGMIGVAEGDVAIAERALRAGGVVAFVDPGREIKGSTVHLARSTYDPATDQEDRHEVDLPATYITLTESWASPSAVISSAAAEALGAPVTTVALAVDGTVTEGQQEDVNEGLAAVSSNAMLYVERGYVAEDETIILQLVLLGLGGVLMLGGTLTATFLALSDARPDLATLSAIGAAAKTRRGVAAAYALVVGGVGALLGAAVGFIPGIAVVFPLTSQPGDTCIIDGGGSCEATGEALGPFLDVPWLMILGLVVALPLLTALIVGVFARSRLPLVARLD